jgi:hypothetical protein
MMENEKYLGVNFMIKHAWHRSRSLHTVHLQTRAEEREKGKEGGEK